MKVDNDIKTQRANWSFSGAVAESFDKHVVRSIPLYEEGHELICKLSDFFCQPDSTCYELGCATGALTKKLAAHNAHKPGSTWIGIDKEADMIAQANEKNKTQVNVEFIADDILLYDYKPADLIVSYYTIQFVAEKHRQEIFNKIYQSLNWGGAFILFEKVRAPDARFQDMMSSLYVDFKSDKGFTAEQILNKTQSLKSVMSPFSTQANYDLLKRAGFVDYMTVMKYVSFEGILAIK